MISGISKKKFFFDNEYNPLFKKKDFILIAYNTSKNKFSKNKILIKKRKNIFLLSKDFAGFLAFSLSYFLFYLSFEKCFEGFDECCVKFSFITKIIIEEIISCIIITLLIELIIYKIISKLHLIHFIFVFIIFYKYNHGLDFDDHGYYNIMFFIVIVSIMILGLLPLNFIIYFKNKNNKKIILLNILFIFIIFLVLYHFLISNNISCDDWKKGLNNTSINNDIKKYGCQIQFPKKCPYKIGKYFQDLTKLKGIKCENYKTKKAKENLIKHSKSPYPFIIRLKLFWNPF